MGNVTETDAAIISDAELDKEISDVLQSVSLPDSLQRKTQSTICQRRQKTMKEKELAKLFKTIADSFTRLSEIYSSTEDVTQPKAPAKK